MMTTGVVRWEAKMDHQNSGGWMTGWGHPKPDTKAKECHVEEWHAIYYKGCFIFIFPHYF